MYPAYTTIETHSAEEARLRRLHRLLAYEGSLVGAGAIEYFAPYGLVVALVALAAVIFAPYMVWQLFRLRRFGWILGAALAVGLSAVAGHLMGVGKFLLPLGAFFVYLWVLRHAVGKWVEELESVRLVEGYGR